MSAIYRPKGKAAEYSKWAANFYNFCTGGCIYCYLNEKPLCLVRTKEKSLKKCFKNEEKAFDIFRREVNKNIDDLRTHGILFNFGSDPFLKETFELNKLCILYATLNEITVKTLTKQTWWINDEEFDHVKEYIKTGFTLTGHDELEPGCTTNAERIEAMKILKMRGFKTWASIEPIIDFSDSFVMISKSKDCCDHYKIGLFSKENQKKYLSKGCYDIKKLFHFVNYVSGYLRNNTIYWKDDLLKQARINREDLPSNCVNRDYF